MKKFHPETEMSQVALPTLMMKDTVSHEKPSDVLRGLV
jgi:hypothetical protein